MDEVARRSRARGVLVGLAVGDALGAPVEFQRASQIAGRRDELFELPGGGPFGWAPGEFTDDTQMAIVLARHLIANGGGVDQATLVGAFAEWARDAADVGNQTRRVLGQVRHGVDWRAATEDLSPEAAGNGSLMRVAPVALSATSSHHAAELARAQSEVTHPNESCRDACAVFASALWDELDGERIALDVLAGRCAVPEVREAIEQAQSTGPPPMSGWVLHTLTGALWAVDRADSFADAAWRAVALGEDADTVGAVAGAVAGARWGVEGIPEALTTRLQSRHPLFVADYPGYLVELADELLEPGGARAEDP